MALEIDDILMIRQNRVRLVYVGNDAAQTEVWVTDPNHPRKLRFDPYRGQWQKHGDAGPLTEEQIAFWLARKAEG